MGNKPYLSQWTQRCIASLGTEQGISDISITNQRSAKLSRPPSQHSLLLKTLVLQVFN